MSTDLDDLRLMGEWHEVKLQDTAVSMLCVPLGIVGIGASKLESAYGRMGSIHGSALHVRLAKRFCATVDYKRFPCQRRSTEHDDHQRRVSTVLVCQIQE